MNQTPYQHAYAKHAPEMRARWAGNRDRAALAAAKADILATIPLHPADCSYVGKLYAELDAIRDVENNRRWWPAPVQAVATGPNGPICRRCGGAVLLCHCPEEA